MDAHCNKIRLAPVLERVVGGKFAQQVICRDCPHRSEREEHFTGISVDVRNKRNLQESLASYVQVRSPLPTVLSSRIVAAQELSSSPAYFVQARACARAPEWGSTTQTLKSLPPGPCE